MRSSCPKILKPWVILCTTIKFHLIGVHQKVSFHWSHLLLGNKTCFKELNSSQVGWRRAAQFASGFQDSSSHRLSSQQLCRTLPVNISLRSMSWTSISRLLMSINLTKSLRNQMMVFTVMVCLWKVLAGTALLTSWMTRTPSSSTLKCQSFGLYLRETESSQLLAFTTAHATRFWADRELFQLLVTQPTIVWWLSCQATKSTMTGSEQESLSF